MLSDIVEVLVNSSNGAADDVLLEALARGNDAEKALALDALLRRESVAGLSGVIAQWPTLPQALQLLVLDNIKLFHTALRESVRSRDPATAQSAMKLIALGRQGKLTYTLTERLHGTDEATTRAAVEAMVALARWIATETRKLQKSPPDPDGSDDARKRATLYQQIVSDRPEIESAITRAMDVHRGKHGPDLLRAALLLADSPQSKTFSILQTPKHGGQSVMVRRLQQPPESENVDAFLLGASHGGMRAQFGLAFSHIADGPVLDALLRRTHWLKDHQLHLSMHQVSRGAWWGDADLEKELARRDADDIARIGEWIAASGVHDVVQDERLEKLRVQIGSHLPGRLRLLRIAMRRPKGASVAFLRACLNDPDERIVRMAAREFVRRKPGDYDQILIQLMTVAPETVRRVIGRAVGQVGFDQYWYRFDKLDKSTRRAAGRAMVKVLPDAVQRLERRIKTGPLDQRLKGIQIAHELSIAEHLTDVLLKTCHDPNAKLRSKAVAVLATINIVPPENILERVLNDEDPRVRANAIEVLEARHRVDFVPMLAQRARSGGNRERANAIKALHRMRVGVASQQLLHMLQDDRPEHRISALWALRQIGWWQLLNEVARLAKSDENTRVRRYAVGVLKGVAESLPRKPRDKAA